MHVLGARDGKSGADRRYGTFLVHVTGNPGKTPIRRVLRAPNKAADASKPRDVAWQWHRRPGAHRSVHSADRGIALVSRDSTPLPRVLRGARPHRRALRQPRAGAATRRCSSPTPAWSSSRTCCAAPRRAATRAPWTSSAACAWPASTTTSRRSAGRRGTTPSSRCSATGASATTSSARRSTGPGDFLTEGSAASIRRGSPRPPTRTTRRRGPSGATRSACRRSAWRAGATSTRATTTTSGAWPTPARAGRAARSTTTAAPTCPRVRSACRTTARHCPRWLEIWNLVFMEFDQQPDGPRVPLPFKSVDTGMGLERLASVLQGVTTNYDTDLFTPIHARMRELLGHDPETFETERFSYQVIADHSRAMTFLIADGVLPGNEGRGYVLRRIVRRAVRHGRLLGRTEPFLAQTADVVIDTMKEAYPYLDGAARADPRHDPARGGGSSRARSRRAPIQLEEALIPLTVADRVVGRRPEELPDGRAGAARCGGLPPARHLRLPDRPDHRAGGRVRRARRPAGLRRGARRAAQREPLGQEGRPGPPGRAQRRSTTRSCGSRRDQVRRLRDAPRPDAKVVAILRDGTEYQELEAKAGGRAAGRRGRPTPSWSST